MTQACCPACRLRIPSAGASGIAACPLCGELLCTASAAEAIGLALFVPTQASAAPSHAVMAVATMARHEPRP